MLGTSQKYDQILYMSDGIKITKVNGSCRLLLSKEARVNEMFRVAKMCGLTVRHRLRAGEYQLEAIGGEHGSSEI